MASDAELMAAYRQALADYETQQGALATAGSALKAATDVLAEALIPDGARNGEVFGVYIARDLVQLRADSNAENKRGYVVGIRLDVKPRIGDRT